MWVLKGDRFYSFQVAVKQFSLLLNASVNKAVSSASLCRLCVRVQVCICLQNIYSLNDSIMKVLQFYAHRRELLFELSISDGEIIPLTLPSYHSLVVSGFFYVFSSRQLSLLH